MKILIAEDDSVSRRLLDATLSRMGYEVTITENGADAWDVLQHPDAPQMAILDWMMPEMDGIEVCRRIRARSEGGYIYVILLTAKGQKSDVVAGLEAGADDYLIKPFDIQELRARMAVGVRILRLEASLADRIKQLEEARGHVKQLQGLLPICMHCKNIRDDDDTWHRIESYIERYSDAMFTHSLCEDCLKQHYPEHKPKTETVGSSS